MLSSLYSVINAGTSLSVSNLTYVLFYQCRFTIICENMKSNVLYPLPMKKKTVAVIAKPGVELKNIIIFVFQTKMSHGCGRVMVLGL